jgi:DNA-binding CsgD family transcriptional regulator
LGEVAITTQPASAEVLLPAVAARHDITRREQTVIEQALEGLPTKQIARHLDLSQHTVNDHFKAIYRKIGVTSREELMTRLCH